MSRFSRLKRFENAISNRTRDVPAIVTDLPSVIEKTRVPGPTRKPTGALPKRPMLSAGRANAFAIEVGVGGRIVDVAVADAIRRCVAVKPRTVAPVPDGSPLAKDGVRNGPDCNSVMPVTSHPPMSRSSPLPVLLANRRPWPIGNS
jgi:hypothetical protein